MSPPWRILVAALLGLALTGPDVSTTERAAAGLAAAGALFWARPRLGLAVLGLALGALGGLRLEATVSRAARWVDVGSTALVHFETRIDDDTWWVTVGHPEATATAARASRVPPEVRAGDVWRARVRGFPLPRTRNPDDRRALRAALARPAVAGVRIEALESRISARDGGAGRDRALDGAHARWDRVLGEGAGFWRALLLADRRGLERLASDRVQALGFAHLLALSGLHVGVVLGMVALPLRRFGPRALVAALPLLAAWTWVAGAGPSMLRAVVMVACVVLGRSTRRRAAGLEALAVAGLVEIAWRPEAICGIGWWLSYGATLAIVRAAPTLQRLPFVWAALGVSVVAQAATLPWILDAFGRLPILSALVLLLVGPLFTLVLVVGGGCAVLSLLPVPGAQGLAGVAAMLAHAFGWSVHVAEPLGRWALTHAGFDDASWAIVMAITGWWLIPHRWSYPRTSAVLTLVVVGAGHVVLWGPVRHEWVSFDVGQGDLGLYRCDRRVVVVDAGPLSRGRHPVDRSVLTYLERRNLRDVRLVLTHEHMDHVAGARRLLRTGRFGEVVLAATDSAHAWTDVLVALGDSVGVGVRWVRTGDALWSDCCDARVLWPTPGPDLHEANDRSVVLRLGPSSRPLLATGDVEHKGEARLLANLEPSGGAPRGPRWILKVAHHGGNTGTDAELLERIRPEWALISCGAGNRYGHPHPRVLERLGTVGAQVLRTDLDGAIVVRWEGDTIRVQSVTGRP